MNFKESLLEVATFTPISLEYPNPWCGHLPFAAWVIRILKPKVFVELGTHSGNSYFSFCQAVSEGKLSTRCYAVDTWQGDDHAGHYGNDIFYKVNLHNEKNYQEFSSLLRMTFDEALNHFPNESVELLHIDGFHTYEAVKHDFETWLPKLAPGAVVLFHDTNVHQHGFGVWKFWAELTEKYQNNLEFLHSHGLGVLQIEGALNEKRMLWLEAELPEKEFLKNYFSVLGERQFERYELVAAKQQIVQLNNQLILEREKLTLRLEQIRKSISWRLTRPLRFIARLFRYGFIQEDQKNLNQILRNYYYHLPLPNAVRKGISFTYHRLFLKTIRILRRSLWVRKFQAPAIRPRLRERGKPDYLFFGVIDWHFRHQRPQQLALGLVETGRRVFYISPTTINDERAGFIVEPLDSLGSIFQIKIFVEDLYNIYASISNPSILAQLSASLGEVLDWADCEEMIALVQHPFWGKVASILPNSRLIYDCMDHHQGFSEHFSEELIKLERALVNKSELVVATSSALYQTVQHTKRHSLIPNATDYHYFSKLPDNIYRDPKGRPIIGYYGAIAEWFDLELVESLAKQHPECGIVLIGKDTINAKFKLRKSPNIVFIGEVSYENLPYYLHGFDICLLPFVINSLTLATNPVKAYEYLSAGKPVVTVDLPEMALFGDLVYVAVDKQQFLTWVDTLLQQTEAKELIERRKRFASEQTWNHRVEVLIREAESTLHDPLVSVIIVTYNNLKLTEACLSSVDKHSQYANLEIIVVDNASTDGSKEFLEGWVVGSSNRKLILNTDNRGFSAANNQGLAIAKGEYLVLLNNDTYVTPGWVRTLMKHLQNDKTIGLIGPVTNNIGNEAKIDIDFQGMGEMLVQSAAYTRRHIGKTYPLRTAAFFCVMMPREVYECVGALDEVFGRGFFEDDDYCRRVEKIGLRIVCAEDVFVYHHLSASFNKLKEAERQSLFKQNKAIYEAKWGTWIPHAHRKFKP
jgi:GT2 family glycosyltransferase/glycosyltransferase involved in cell wall biosynthesis